MIEIEFTKIQASKFDKDSFIGVQTQVFGSQGTTPSELLHQYGYASRPLDPDEDGTGCSAFTTQIGKHPYAWLAHDPRVIALLPEVLPGESFQYGPKGNFFRCHADGRLSAWTTDDGTIDGRTISQVLSPTKGYEYQSPWGTITHGPNGFTAKHISGARIDFGSIGGLPEPLDQFTSRLSLSAMLVRIEGTIISLGPDSATSSPLTKVNELLTLLGTFTSALSAVNTALVALEGIAAGAPNSGAAVAIGAATTAIGAASSAVAAALPLISSCVTAP